MASSTSASRGGRRRFIFLLLAVIVASGTLFAAFRIGVDRGFPGAIGTQTWGRVLFAVGAAVTQMDHGGYGYTLSTVIETILTYGGLTDDPKILADVASKYPDNLHDSALINAAIVKAARFKWPFNPDESIRGSGGDDIGLVDYARASFYLFGHRLQSLYFSYFLFFGISVAAFIVTFRDRPEVLALLVIACIAHLFFFASGIFDLEQTASIADPRCLSVLATIPGLHIACLMLWRARLSAANLALAGIQSIILVFAFWIRASAIWVVVGLALVAFAIVLKWLFDRRLELARLWSFGVLLSVLAVHTLYVSIALHPIYRVKGEISHHVFWHGVFFQLQLHPQWKEKYGPQFDNATFDLLPDVAAKKYLEKYPSSDPDIYLLEDRSYLTVAARETYARKAFFDFLSKDPKFVFEIVFLHKPKRIVTLLSQYLDSLFHGSSIGYAAAFLVLLVVAGILAAGGRAEYRRVAGGVLLLTCSFFVSLLPIVLTIPAMMVEQYYILLIALGGWVVLVLSAGLRATMRLVERPRTAMPATVIRDAGADNDRTKMISKMDVSNHGCSGITGSG
jgi:hypothetical protein